MKAFLLIAVAVLFTMQAQAGGGGSDDLSQVRPVKEEIENTGEFKLSPSSVYSLLVLPYSDDSEVTFALSNVNSKAQGTKAFKPTVYKGQRLPLVEDIAVTGRLPKAEAIALMDAAIKSEGVHIQTVLKEQIVSQANIELIRQAATAGQAKPGCERVLSRGVDVQFQGIETKFKAFQSKLLKLEELPAKVCLEILGL